MGSPGRVVLPLAFLLAGACSGAVPVGNSTGTDSGAAAETGSEADEAGVDGSAPPDGGGDASGDADSGTGCFVSSVGVFGDCMTVSGCAALGNHTSTPGYCPGPAGIECCTVAPNVADNPPVPAGWKLMPQAAVTPDMTTWAVMILHDPTTYPMFSTAMRTFGTLNVMARVEWHPPDFQNNTVHRGVTLYEPG